MKRILKSVFLASTASALIATTTLAADLPDEVVAPDFTPAPVQATDYDWSGAYVGINLGLGFGSEFDNNAGIDLDTDAALLAGGVVGYNHQINKFVVGVEGDLNYTRLDALGGGIDADLNFLGTFTARAGYTPIDRVLTYVEGGYAFGQVDAVTAAGSDESINSGFVLGAGAEYAITDNILSGVEYNYVDLAEQDLPGGTNAEFIGHLVKFNLKYKF